jgi:hypothetical protein
MLLSTGMLLAGFALRNVPGISVAGDIHTAWSGALRYNSIIFITLFTKEKMLMTVSGRILDYLLAFVKFLLNTVIIHYF